MAKKIKAELGVIRTSSDRMTNVLTCAEAASQTDQNIMICGETGTGRDTLAEAVHNMSSRNDEPMYVVRCGRDSLEEILGLSSGITYLDEVHRLPKRLQKMLLIRLMDDGEGMRIISSADRCIDDMKDRGLFYSRLYDRLSGIRIDVPNLRERTEDIGTIVRDLLKNYCRKYGKYVTIEAGALKLLKYYRYPGNIAELDCIIQRAVLINTSGTIKTNSIMSILDMENVVFASLVKGTNLEYNKEMDRLSRELLINALRNTRSVRKAASQLNLSYATMQDKCKGLGINAVKYVSDT